MKAKIVSWYIFLLVLPCYLFAVGSIEPEHLDFLHGIPRRVESISEYSYGTVRKVTEYYDTSEVKNIRIYNINSELTQEILFNEYGHVVARNHPLHPLMNPEIELDVMGRPIYKYFTSGARRKMEYNEKNQLVRRYFYQSNEKVFVLESKYMYGEDGSLREARSYIDEERGLFTARKIFHDGIIPDDFSARFTVVDDSDPSEFDPYNYFLETSEIRVLGNNIPVYRVVIQQQPANMATPETLQDLLNQMMKTKIYFDELGNEKYAEIFFGEENLPSVLYEYEYSDFDESNNWRSRKTYITRFNNGREKAISRHTIRYINYSP